MRRLALRTVAVLAVAAVALILWRLRSSLLTLGLAVVIASSLDPLIRRETMHRVPRWLAISSVYLAAALIFGGAVSLLGSLLPAEVRRVADGLQHTLTWLRTYWPAPLPPLPTSIDFFGDDLGAAVVATSTTAVHVMIRLCLALVLSLCWSISAGSIERSWLSLLPPSTRRRTRDVWRTIFEAAGSQIRAESIQSLVSLLALAAVFSLLRVPYATVAALLVAIARVVPLFGVGFATLAAFACGAARSIPQATLAAAATLILLEGLSHLVERRIVVVRPPRVVAGLVLIALFEVLGWVGLLIAPVVSAMLATFALEWFQRSSFHEAPTDSASLHLQLSLLQRRLSSHDEPLRPEVANLVQRLDALIRETTPH